MQQTFVFDKVAIVVAPWPSTAPARTGARERGARVEVRLLADEPRRGSRTAAQRIVIDQPLFRADLFDRTEAPPGNLAAAHFHPRFRGVQPGRRNWSEAMKQDPIGWLVAELGDLRGLLERSGCEFTDAPWVDGDAAQVSNAVPAVIAAVYTAWAEARSDVDADGALEFLNVLRSLKPSRVPLI